MKDMSRDDGIRISDHAVVRYMERIMGMDIPGYQQELLSDPKLVGMYFPKKIQEEIEAKPTKYEVPDFTLISFMRYTKRMDIDKIKELILSDKKIVNDILLWKSLRITLAPKTYMMVKDMCIVTIIYDDRCGGNKAFFIRKRKQKTS